MDSAATTLRAVIVVTLILGGASAARAQPIFATGFEPSDVTWATSIGFVFFAESFDTGTSSLATGSTSATVVWHRSTVESASAPDSLQVSNPLTGTYQDDSLRVSATATTPLLSLPPEGAVLSFALLKDTEGDPSHDELFVDALDSSASVLQTWTFGFEYPAFTTFRRLLPYAAGGVRGRFRFFSE